MCCPTVCTFVILYTDHSNEKREREREGRSTNIELLNLSLVLHLLFKKSMSSPFTHTHTHASQNYNLVLHGRRFRLLLFLLHDVVSPVSIYKTNFVVLHGIRPHSSASIHAILLPFD